eukprot:gene2853-biopygen2795
MLLIRYSSKEEKEERQKKLAKPPDSPDSPLKPKYKAEDLRKAVDYAIAVTDTTERRLAQRAGLHPEAYSGHSFRRGGATTAFRLQVQDSLIQAHGDWASECYKLYCDLNESQRLILPSAMAAGAAAVTTAFQARQ